MRKLVLLLLTIFSLQAFSQEYKLVAHNVKLGESVRMLSKKYQVAPSEIYRFNKFAIDGLSQGMVLQIPVEVKESPVVYEESVADVSQGESASAVESNASSQELRNDSNEIKHQVEKGETLFSLAKKYSISVADLKSQNEAILNKGLQSGQVITIRINN